MNDLEIKNKIHTIRGLQVMLDRDLATLYGVETKVLNQAIKRNMERFPLDFMFQLTGKEFEALRSQIVTLNKDTLLRSQNAILNNDVSSMSQNATSNTEASLRFQNGTLEKGRGKHRKYLPYAFTEQGVATLSGVLKSPKAVEINIQIVRAFVSMRRFISANLQIFQRLDHVEKKQLAYEIKTDKKFEQIFSAIESKDIKPDKGIFFNGQIFDAYKFVSDLIRNTKKSIILIDNYVDESVLTLFSKRNKNVKVTIYTKGITRQLSLDLEKYNSQYPS